MTITLGELGEQYFAISCPNTPPFPSGHTTFANDLALAAAVFNLLPSH